MGENAELYTVHKGKRYRATLSLGFFQRWASNTAVAAKLEDVGFSNVEVTGDGGTRYAQAWWEHADATAKRPSEIVNIAEYEV